MLIVVDPQIDFISGTLPVTGALDATDGPAVVLEKGTAPDKDEYSFVQNEGKNLFS